MQGVAENSSQVRGMNEQTAYINYLTNSLNYWKKEKETSYG